MEYIFGFDNVVSWIPILAAIGIGLYLGTRKKNKTKE